MSGDQKNVVRIVITVVAIGAAVFVAIPCCISGYMWVSYKQQENRKALKELQDRQEAEQKLRDRQRP